MARIQPPPLFTGLLTELGDTKLTWRNWFQSIYTTLIGSYFNLETIEVANQDKQDFIQTITGSNSVYEIRFVNLLMSSLNSQLILRASTDSGVTFLEEPNQYEYMYTSSDGGSSSGYYSSIVLSGPELGNNIDYCVNGVVTVTDPGSSTRYKTVSWSINYKASDDVLVRTEGCGKIRTYNSVNGIRILPSAGQLVSGKIKLYNLQ